MINPRNLSPAAFVALLALGGVGLLFIKFLLAHVFVLLLLVGVGAATVWKLQDVAAQRREVRATEQAQRATIEREEQHATRTDEVVEEQRQALPPRTAIVNPFATRQAQHKEV